MTCIDDALDGLSPEQRAVLELLIRDEWDASNQDAIAPRSDRSSWPLSFAQQRLWFLDQLSPGDPAYNIHGAIRLRGPLRVDALERSLEEVARRHEALRANFLAVGGGPRQVVAPPGPQPLPVADLRGFSPELREAEAVRLAVEEARRPFDLARDDLFRATLLLSGEEEAILLVTMHHIASDGWSVGVLFREVSALYGAFVAGLPSPLAPLPIQYADFAAWQRARLQGEPLEREIEHWRGRLAELPELRLPQDSASRGPRGGAVPVAIPSPLSDRLRAIGRSEGASLFMVLLAAFAALLHRWSGQRDFGIGAPVANRNRHEIEGLIGFFVNTLVLRADLSGDPAFTDLVARAKREALDALSHQDLPFEKLVEELRPERRPGRTPLVPVMFGLQNAPLPSIELPGLGVSSLQVHNGTVRFDLSLVLGEGDEGIAGELVYDANLVSSLTALRIADGFQRLAERMAAEPWRPLSEISPLSEAERHQMLVEWVGEARPRSPCTFVEMFESQAARTPEAPAVVYGAAVLSYRALDRRANRIARRLRRLGVGLEGRVALYLERSVDMVAAILGAMKAGGAYVPLDPSWPSHRLSLLLEDAEPAVVVTGSRPAADLLLLEGKGAHLLSLEEDLREESEEPTGYVPALSSVAYILHTSGSTGRPKGTLVSHAALAAFAHSLRRVVPELRSLEPLRLSVNASFAFDSSIKQIVQLTAGHALYPVPEEARRDGGAMASFLRESRLDGFDCTPSQLETLLPAFEASGQPPRFVLVGGEAISPRLWKTLAEHPRTLFYNVYGPTECTVDTTAATIGGDRPSLGRPLPGYRVHLLDAHLQPAPAGAQGEIWVGGESLARGYWRRPDLTAERFRPDPLGEEPGARLYRTGDLGLWLPDGRIDFLGRVDEQIKVRGVRVEPGEIESCLLSHPEVREAAVGLGEAEKRLVAWVVPTGGRAPDPQELLRWLRERLPEPMVPAAIAILGSLPRTPNGKLDRRALPDPEPDGAAEPAVPSDPLEMGMIDLFRELLGAERIGPGDSFFEMGGHSLLAARLASRVHATFGVELPVRRLFESPTAAGLAQVVRDIGRDTPPLPPVRRVPRGGSAPLSFVQRRLWVLHQLNPELIAYHVPAGLRLRGSLEVAVLAATLSEIIRRHEALRTRFPVVNGEPVQAIEPPAPVFLPEIDLSALPAAEREAEALRIGGEEARRLFDLEHGPLLRLRLVRLGREENALFLTVHHLVSDGWSAAIFLRELSVLYSVFSQGGASPLPEPAVQYADYAVWQHEQLQGETLEAQLQYWRERLASAPRFLDLPTDHPPSRVESYAGANVPLWLEAERVEALRRLARSSGVTLYMTLLAAFQALLARWSGEETICVGAPVAGRNRLEIEGLIGFFVNTLVIRTDLGDAPPVRDLLARVREAALGAFTHQDLPFERLVEALNPERDARTSPLFQVSFALQNAPREELRLPGLAVARLDVDTDTAQFDLIVSLAETEAGIEGSIRYRTALRTEPTIRRMAAGFNVLLAGLAADPERPVAELPILAEAELRQILSEWSGSGALPARKEESARTFPALFEAQVDRTPEAPALVFGSTALSYRELDRRSNRVAHRLRRLGAGPEVRVVVCLERSSESIVALLGVLKAGGTYVPLDPAAPRERLALLLEDAAPAVVFAARDLSLPGGGWTRLTFEDDLSAESEERIGDVASPDSLAYFIYTSGSTGKPKGSLVSHRALAAFARALRRAVPELREPSLRLGLNASFIFDASLQQIVQLAGGHALYLIPEEARRDGVVMADFLRESGLEGFDCTPSQLEVLLPAIDASGHPPRFLLVGGEAISPALWKTLAEHPRIRFYNVYGPTECTVDATSIRIEGGRPSLGRPLPGYRIHLLDARLQPVPAGARGEVWIGGEALARGYWRRPDLTADRFRPDPFGEGLGARLYRTGDLGRWLADGRIDFLGRADQQIKLRGFRIEPGEIEACLLSHPGVREAAAGLREDNRGEKRLTAWVVPAGAHPPDPRELRRFIRERLPESMVPATFAVLDALPRTPSGKLDRRALSERGRRPVSPDVAAPPGSREQRLIELFREVLGVERVGLGDSFFELGGHSLSALRLATRIRESFGVRLAVRKLFATPTVSGLAEIIRQMEGSAPPLPPIRRASRKGSIPLSFAQRRLWVLHQLSPGLTAYHIPAALRMRGHLDRTALDGALSEIFRRHEALRTRFPLIGGEPAQVIDPPTPLQVPELDLSALPEASREAEERRFMTEAARRSFSLEHDPLVRLYRLRSGAEDHTLLLVAHHLISDGWSAAIFLRELSVLYSAYIEKMPSPLPGLVVQYADYAIWQREQIDSEVLETQLRYWRERLASAPRFLDLPTDYPRPEIETQAGASVPLRLPGSLVESLRRLGQSEGGTFYTTALAGFQALLARWSGESSISVGTHVARRNHLEIEGLIGFFVNTLVIRTVLAGTLSGRELVRRVKEGVFEAFAHQDVPFEKLVEALKPERDPRYTPLFQVAFALQNAPREELRLPGLEVSPLDLDTGTAQFDLNVSLVEAEDGAAGEIRYRPALFAETTIRRLAMSLETLLAGMVADPERPVADLSVLTEAARFQVLVEWSGAGPRSYVLSAGMHPLPAGARGDIWIGGASTGEDDMEPYHAADRLRPDPFAEEPGGRLYRTGELARWLPDGRIAPCDRAVQPETRTPALPRTQEQDDSLRDRLLELFQEVLGIESIQPQDSLFDLGGHSLTAARLVSRIRETFGVNLHAAELFRASTAQALADRLRPAVDAGQQSLLFSFHSQGAGSPFFCVHPGGGGIFAYRELADRLGGGIPFYGIQAAGLLDGEEPLREVGPMAERYLEEIRTVQPQGPWRLGGWSFGGLVALEMARRLGEGVEALVLIDPTDPRAMSLQPLDEVGLLAAFARDLGLAPERLGLTLQEALAMDSDMRMAHLLEAVQKAGAPEADLADLRRRIRVFQANLDALRAYRLTPWNGPLTVFEAADRPPGAGSWRDLASDVRILPGTHHSILAPPGVEELARSLREILQRKAV